ncbi:MAG TPA: BREX protein BrxB domain-containing protein [Ktedonobacterales bacterium]|nr:BREX protein BrxB domain-containing protein [Ktedonobacterales bacterium]
MLSLEERFDLLERDLTASPMRIANHTDLPFAILRYEPDKEWEMRRQARQLTVRLEQTGKRVVTISLAELLWEAVEQTEGLEALVDLERESGFAAAEEQVTTYLSHPYWKPLPDTLAQRMSSLDPAHDIVFLMRATVMAPSIYQMSRLLDEMQRRTNVPAILFYPGTLEGAVGLRFMDLKDRDAMGNYRVKVYG